MATFTFLEAAQRLAELEPHVGPTGYFHSQLRDFASRELIEPAGFRGSGRTATTLIDEISLARGKIFSVLTRIGLKSGQISQVARQLHRAITKTAASEVDEVWIVKTKGLPRPVVEGIKAGKAWWLVVMFEPTADRAGLGTVLAQFEEAPPDLTRHRDRHLAVVALDATAHLRPLLTETAATEQPEPAEAAG